MDSDNPLDLRAPGEAPAPAAGARMDLDERQYQALTRAATIYLVRHRIQPQASREDLIHEALVKALEQFDPARGTSLCSFFIHVVLHRLMLNHVRDSSTRAVVGLDESQPATDCNRDPRRADRLARALDDFRASLSREHQQVFDAALQLLGSLRTQSTAQGVPHNFGSRGAEIAGLSRYLFLKAWKQVGARLTETLAAQGFEPEDSE